VKEGRRRGQGKKEGWKSEKEMEEEEDRRRKEGKEINRERGRRN
jgi:hypothetical protein